MDALRQSMRDLCNPQMLTIRIEGSDREFKLPRGLLVLKSSYFEKAFNEKWQEGQASIIELKDDAEEWMLECFIGWLYTGLIIAIHIPRNADDEDEHDPNDAITWNYTILFALYIFADRYDTRAFRNDIMDTIIVKCLQTKPHQYLWPNSKDMAEAFENLPDSAPLYRFLLEAVVIDMNMNPRVDPDEEMEEMDFFSKEILIIIADWRWRLIKKLQCRACTDLGDCDRDDHADIRLLPYYATDVDMCRYHEHVAEEEESQCASKWKGLRESRGIEVANE